ncbi:MAG: ribonuclease HII [bacterium]|nr:ribonuclease HII [bacterium]
MRRCIAFTDEAGRGPLAGPVVAAVVVVQGARALPAVKDSKQLSESKREAIFEELISHSGIVWATGMVSERVIDRINIFEATKLAMKRAFFRLPFSPELLVIDGNFFLDLPVSQQAVVKADETIFGCQAASIIAKVTRDRMMRRYDARFPGYGFARHKGYGTVFHREKIQELGPCPIHRMSFAPLRERGE